MQGESKRNLTSLDALVAFSAKAPIYSGQELKTVNDHILVTFSLGISQ